MTDETPNEVSPDGVAQDGAGSLEEELAAEDEQLTTALAIASLTLSALGFLTLLRLADRKERTPFRALGLFFATTLESTGGTALGLAAVGRSKESGRPGKRLLLAAGGTVLGVITTVLNFNWMRTRRRV